MPTLRNRADVDQARELGSRLYAAEYHLRRALVDVSGLNRRRAGQVHDMIRRLQVMRLEIGVERLDAELFADDAATAARHDHAEGGVEDMLDEAQECRP